MARIIEAEASNFAIDATGEVFQKAAKVRGLAGTMKSFGSSANAFSSGVNRSIGRVSGAMRTMAPVAAGAASFEAMRGVRDIVHDAVQATASRAHEAARMEVSGMSQSEIADAERVSQELSERYRALSTTTIMHALRNMRAIVGTYEEAGKILDPILVAHRRHGRASRARGGAVRGFRPARQGYGDQRGNDGPRKIRLVHKRHGKSD